VAQQNAALARRNEQLAAQLAASQLQARPRLFDI
jgi:hypothetical protein